MSVVFAMFCWAGAGIAVKEALVVFSPLTLIVLRFSLAIVLMLLVGLLFRGHEVLGLQRVEKRDIPLFVLGGLFQPFLYFIFETYTYQSFASPTIAEAMLSTQPIMAPILAFIILREKVVGILLSTVGMLLLLLVGANNFALGNPWGVLLAIVTVSMSVGYTIILRRIPTRYSSLSIVFYVQLVALVLFYAVWGVFDRQSLQDTIVPLSADLSPVIAVGYLAVFASVTAFILFCYTVRQIGVTRANVFNNVRPVFTALLMWVIFDEQLPIWKWVGIIVIVIGLFISQKQRKIE